MVLLLLMNRTDRHPFLMQIERKLFTRWLTPQAVSNTASPERSPSFLADWSSIRISLNSLSSEKSLPNILGKLSTHLKSASSIISGES